MSGDVGSDVEACLWPAGRRDEMTAALAQAAGLEPPFASEPFHLSYAELAPVAARAAASAQASASVARRAPAALRALSPSGTRDGALLAVVGYAGADARLLAPDGRVVVRPAAAVAAWLRGEHERAAGPDVDGILARAALPPARAASARAALLGAGPGATSVAEGWRLRPVPRSLPAALREAGVLRRLSLAGVGYGAQLGLFVLAWWLVGARALGHHGGGGGASGPGAGDGGLLAWIGVLAALVAVKLASSWAAGRLALDGGEVLRARLMDGLLGLDTEPLRAEGIGQLLGRVMEIEAVEALALGGGLLALAAVFELATGTAVLALGATGARHMAILSVWLAVSTLLAARLWRSLRAWARLRIELTHDLVERMVGHRTLVAQQPPALRHRDEDRALDAYARAGRAFDRDGALLAAIVPRGWLLAGVAAIAPALALAGIAGQPGAGPGAGAIATSLGGVLFVYGALRKLAQALPSLMAAEVAWRQVAQFFAGTAPPVALAPARASVSAATPAPAPAATLGAAATLASATAAPALISGRELGYKYATRAKPVLAGLSLDIRRGDRVLLEGPSGGGKSTLGSLLCGLRVPDAGVLALDGVEQGALGVDRWRARVGAVPQFHENHVFSNSFLFNLLLGRAWPPGMEDVRDAEAICRELDLGPLLARMPSGLEQLVGEGGWQLSHGERSRLFIARALLQPLDARVLDESFAALDPETMERALACVLRRADTLIVIAHP